MLIRETKGILHTLELLLVGGKYLIRSEKVYMGGITNEKEKIIY